MPNQTREAISWWVDLVWKVSTPCVVVGAFYLHATFAKSSDVAAMKEAIDGRITKAETAILLLTKDNEANTRQDVVIADHESRLRILERAGALAVGTAKKESYVGP